MSNIKEYFPFFKEGHWNYLDNAATSQKPKVMMDALVEYYTKYNSNIGRSVYDLAYESEQIFINSCEKIKSFLGKNGQLSFSDGCTASLNEAVFHVENIYKTDKKYADKDTVILSVFEHHANIMAWQRFANNNKLKIYWIESEKELEDFRNIPKEIIKKTLVMGITHVNNVTGEINNLESINELKKENNFLLVVDGAQSITNIKKPIKELDVDFYAFSAHKIYGPMGLGVLWINKNISIKNPYKLGGGIIEDVTKKEYILSNEANTLAGTPNIANIYALAKVMDWIENIEAPNYEKMIHSLIEKLKEIIGVEVLEISKKLKKTNIVSIYVKSVHAHDLGTYLSQKGVAVRAGKHCAHTFLNEMKINSSIRVSLGIYNDEKDLEDFIEKLKSGIKYFN